MYIFASFSWVQVAIYYYQTVAKRAQKQCVNDNNRKIATTRGGNYQRSIDQHMEFMGGDFDCRNVCYEADKPE